MSVAVMSQHTKTDWLALADQVGRDIARHAAKHDRNETFVAEGFAALKSADFFAVDTFPTLTFTSSRIIDRGNGQFDVAGELTIRGVTQAMVLPVSFLGRAKDPWGTEKLAFETAVTIDREEFGLVWNAPLEAGGFLVGDQVTEIGRAHV